MCNSADVTRTQLSITCLTLNLAKGPHTFEEDETEEVLHAQVLRTLR
jgi:hypothetical protein